MYAQVTVLGVPIGQMDALRDLIQNQYLPEVQNREGFVMAHLLEAIDDPETAQIITYWDSQKAIEAARKTGSLNNTVQALAIYMPGVRIQRQGYIVTLKIEGNAVRV